jgi:DNA polymerase III epsilon subunit-like protein
MEKYLVFDTETTNSIDDPIVYDIGFAVIDDMGKIYESHSYVVADVFLDEELMASAYFADKIPQYWKDIQEGKRHLRRLKTIKFILKDVCRQHNITKIIAHNAAFDYKSCNFSQRYLTSSKYRWFFPYGVEIWDSLKMAREIFGKDKEYQKFCADNNYLTTYKKPKFTAEVLYKYLSGDNNFIESHTGLEDVMIEKEIFVECLRRGCIDGVLYAPKLPN